VPIPPIRRTTVAVEGGGLAGAVRISFKLCVEPTDHGRSRRGKKLYLHGPVHPKSLRKPCLGHESATSIL